MRNTGKGSEGLLASAFTKAGAFVFRFKDAAHLHGMNGRPVKSPAMPSDHLITYQGRTFFAETKSTSDPDRFSFSMLQPEQRKTGIKQTRAGGDYLVFVHHLPTARWFCIPYRIIDAAEQAGKKSFRWDALENGYEWSLPQ